MFALLKNFFNWFKKEEEPQLRDTIFCDNSTENGIKTWYTYFPETWSQEMIEKSIKQAYKNPIQKLSDKIIGKSKNGVIIQMYLEKKKILRAFPAKIYNIKGHLKECNVTLNASYR
ncbi:MAG: EndoU domain-containing protein [Candidatus Babeliales bacterium]